MPIIKFSSRRNLCSLTYNMVANGNLLLLIIGLLKPYVFRDLNYLLNPFYINYFNAILNKILRCKLLWMKNWNTWKNTFKELVLGVCLVFTCLIHVTVWVFTGSGMLLQIPEQNGSRDFIKRASKEPYDVVWIVLFLNVGIFTILFIYLKEKEKYI